MLVSIQLPHRGQRKIYMLDMQIHVEDETPPKELTEDDGFKIEKLLESTCQMFLHDKIEPILPLTVPGVFLISFYSLHSHPGISSTNLVFRF